MLNEPYLPPPAQFGFLTRKKLADLFYWKYIFSPLPFPFHLKSYPPPPGSYPFCTTARVLEENTVRPSKHDNSIIKWKILPRFSLICQIR